MTENNTQKRYVGVKETLVYGIANGGQCIGYNLIRGQINIYLCYALGVEFKYVTLMMAFMTFWDAFNDPLMGSIVDKTRTRYGKLRPYLMFVPIPLGLMTVIFFGGATFLSGVDNAAVKTIYMFVTYFLWEFFYTIGDIPFWGLSAAISPNPEDRSRVIKSARLISGIIGGIPGIIMVAFIDLQKSGVLPFSLATLFLVFGILGGTIGMVLFSLAGFCTKERIVPTNDEPKLLDCFRYLIKNKPLLLLTISSLIGTIEGIGGNFTTYYYSFSLGIASLSLLAGLPGTIASYSTYAVMSKLERRWSSKQIVTRISLIHACVTVVVFLVGCRFYRNPAVIVPLLAIQGVSSSIGGSIKAVIPTKMIGETVDYMEWKTGERNEGMGFSILTFVGKLTGSLSTTIATALMPVLGFVQQTGENGDVLWHLPEEGPVNTRFWMWGLVTCIPTVLGLLALIPYKFYDLDKEKLETIQKEILERREKAALAEKEAE